MSKWFLQASRYSPFVIFTVIMMIKLSLARYVIFQETNFLLSAVTELPALFVFFFAIELLARKRKVMAYMIANVIITCVYFAAIMYSKYFGVVVTYRALQQAGQVTEVDASVMQLLHPYFLFIYTDIVVYLLLYGFVKKIRRWSLSVPPIPVRAAGGLLAGSAILALINMGMHADIVNDIKRAEKMGIVSYELDTIIGDLEPRTLINPELVTRSAIEQAKGIQMPQSPAYYGAAKGRNVIVVQVEAMQNFLHGLKIDGKEVTPVLNSLIKESFYFPRIYQMVGQGNTADAEFMLNTSYYIPPDGAASQTYGYKSLPSLPKLLAENGYTTRTFHTNDAVFWNRKNLYPALGFDKYYDAEYFGDEDPVMFGASDEVLFNKTVDELQKLDQAGKPFYVNIITMSSHHPFDLPQRKIKLALPGKDLGTFVGDYLQAENYADYALGILIDRLKRAGIWDHSVLVVYGDHMGLPINSLSDDDKALLKELLGKEYQYEEMMNIPLIVTIPGVTEEKTVSQLGGQVDFMPTIANLLGVSLKDHVYFGEDLLNQSHNLLPQRYYLPSGSFINDDVINIPGEQFRDGTTIAVGDGRIGGSRQQDEDDFNRALKLLEMSDSYVASLPEREP